MTLEERIMFLNRYLSAREILLTSSLLGTNDLRFRVWVDIDGIIRSNNKLIMPLNIQGSVECDYHYRNLRVLLKMVLMEYLRDYFKKWIAQDVPAIVFKNYSLTPIIHKQR